MSTHASTRPHPQLFITVSTPWAIRNYFQTGIVSMLAKHASITALATPAMARALRASGYESFVRIEEWECGPEPALWRLARQLRKKLYMETHRVHTETIWERYARRPVYQRLSAPLISLGAKLVGNRGLKFAQAMDVRLNRSKAFREVFREHGSGLLFATHADTFFEEAVLRSALLNGVDATLMVLSWDHLSTKVVLSPYYRRLLVWTDLQREEVIDNYPWYTSEQVAVVGIPHYDLYYQPTPTSRVAWCQRHGLDPAKRTIVFYTMPQSRHETQHLIIERLAAEIEVGVSFPRDLQILIKCHPWDDPACYAYLPQRFRCVSIYATRLHDGATPADWIPDPHEIAISRDCLAFADVTCNIYSTVTIEAALFNKPIVHVAFDVEPLPKGRVPCREYYNFTHFKPIVDTNASTLAHSQDEFHRFVKQALASPDDRAQERRRLAEQFLGPLDGRSSERVVNELLKLVGITNPSTEKTSPSSRVRSQAEVRV